MRSHHRSNDSSRSVEAPSSRNARRDLDQFAKVLILAATEAELAEVGFWCANYQRRPKPEYRELLFTKLGNVKAHLTDYEQLRMTADDRRIIKTVLGGAVELIDSEINQVLSLDDQIREARQKFIDLRLHMDRLLDRDIQVLTAENLRAPRAAAERAAAIARMMAQFLTPVYVVTAMVMAALAIRLLLIPLRQLTRGFKALERGDLMRRVAVEYNDEFADLARGFNDMVDRLRKTTVSRDSLERTVMSVSGWSTFGSSRPPIAISPCLPPKTNSAATSTIVSISFGLPRCGNEKRTFHCSLAICSPSGVRSAGSGA